MLASTVLHGCMFSPGQYMDTRQLTRDGSPESQRIELIPITPKLIAMDAAVNVRQPVAPALLSYVPVLFLLLMHKVKLPLLQTHRLIMWH